MHLISGNPIGNPLNGLVVGWLIIACCTGCHTFNQSSKDAAVDQAIPLQGSEAAEVYKRIQQAKSQNSIVLQVSGDSQPIRVLPMPTDGTPIFVSDLLKQTGVQEKFGRMIVSVYRSSPVDYAGARMDVRFDEQGETVRPETDYALQSGDRVKIMKDPRTSFGKLLDQVLPSNASRAIIGR